MEKLMFKLAFLVLIGSCTFQVQAQDSLAIEKNDSTSMIEVEYTLIVFEPGYDMFLMSQPSMLHYSYSYYRNWNVQYVQEWNVRARTNTLVGAFQEVIDYSPHTDYGIELEYKLYYFFRFIERKYNITLIPRGR
jgi:hypothetical protein